MEPDDFLRAVGPLVTTAEPPRLIADIGGTFARFALETAAGRFEHTASLRCAEHADFHAAVSAYLSTLTGPAPRHAAVAIANPVEGDQVRMTNYPWAFSIETTREQLGLDTLVVVNDFTALAMSLPRLGRHERRQVGGGDARSRSVIGVLGAGTGLGVSGLIPAVTSGHGNDGWIALGTEGGHTSFAPRDEREIDILRFALREHRHVSFERLASGPGLELIHRALRDRAGLPPEPLAAPAITRRGVAGDDALCAEALDVFCAVLGTVASNLAVTLGAFGGIYIGGGIVPRLGGWFDRSPFRARFEDRGRFGDYVAAIPTYVITAENATFAGASAILAEQLKGQQGASGSSVLTQIRRSRENLSPAETRVADHVLAHPRATLNDPIARIAQQAAVSQPTVIRFCRSLGCEGLSDFKLRLAASLTGTVPVTHTQVTGDDSMLELGVKVLGNSAAAVLQLREQLNREAIDRATDLLTHAGRVEVYAIGHCAVVAEDARNKLLRFGIPSSTVTEALLQPIAARALGPNDVALVISSGGQVDELVAVADIAKERGASVVAITAGQSALARRADVSLIVDHTEDLATHVPMVSRLLQLLTVDILAVGVAMRRGSAARAVLPADAVGAMDDARREPPAPPPASRRQPGVSTAAPLAKLTSHSR